MAGNNREGNNTPQLLTDRATQIANMATKVDWKFNASLAWDATNSEPPLKKRYISKGPIKPGMANATTPIKGDK